MNFFLDENFPLSCGEYLRSEGHSIFDIRNTVHSGRDDQFVFGLAQEVSAIFLTTDKDFFHTVPHLYAEHSGIIVIALKTPNRESIMQKLRWAYKNLELNNFKSRVVLLTDSHCKIY